jgi:hypothetical protein
MSKARDLANAGTALTTVSATELGYLDGVTSAVQTQINAKEATLPDQTGNTGKYLTTNGTAKSWGTVSQYALPSQTGNSGKFLTTNGTSESWGTVTTPVAWRRRLDSGNVFGFISITYNNSNMYVAVGDTGQIYSSPDGVTWTSRTSQFGTSYIFDVAHANGVFVAVGAAGKISTSSDGITWTARTANMSTNEIRAVTYGNSLWVAVGAGGGTTNTGGITYSSDNGVTWTRKSQSITVGAGYNTVHWNGTNWLVGSGVSTNNYLYATTPSGTWTAALHSGGFDINAIISDGTRTLLNKGDDYWYHTTGTTLSSTTTISTHMSNGAASIQNSKPYNGSIYRVKGPYLTIYTVNSTATPSIENNSILPYSYPNSGLALNSAIQCIGVFSTGMIVGTSNGAIYTSF